jgi:hypothetical protein
MPAATLVSIFKAPDARGACVCHGSPEAAGPALVRCQIELDRCVLPNHAENGVLSIARRSAHIRPMVSITVISLLALVGAGLYLWKRTSPNANGDHDLDPPRYQPLFGDSESSLSPVEAEEGKRPSRFREELIGRARLGDLETLSEAHSSGDAGLYADTLDALLDSDAGRQEDLPRLVSHISKSNEFRANKQLAQRLIEMWKTAPDRLSTTEMIHIAALSDDAETYEQALEAAVEFWRSGKLSGFRPEELIELLVSQYWLIAPEARRGGAGFALKRRLGGVRRELATATPGS